MHPSIHVYGRMLQSSAPDLRGELTAHPLARFWGPTFNASGRLREGTGTKGKGTVPPLAPSQFDAPGKKRARVLVSFVPLLAPNLGDATAYSSLLR